MSEEVSAFAAFQNTMKNKNVVEPKKKKKKNKVKRLHTRDIRFSFLVEGQTVFQSVNYFSTYDL